MHFRAASAAIAPLIVTLCGLSTQGVIAQTDAPPTRVRFFVPYVVARLNPALNVTDRLSGSCFAGSVADAGRATAWRCAAGNRILDPCFESGLGDATEVMCSSGPWSGDVVQLTLESPLPVERRNQDDPANNLPWALELPDGAHCTLLTGATALIAGMRINYGCEGGGSVLGAPDRTLPVWRAQVLPRDAFATDATAIVAAWY